LKSPTAIANRRSLMLPPILGFIRLRRFVRIAP
jgi:hypothetical protein